MTIVLEGQNSVFFGASASLVEENYETASEWAKPLITPLKDRSWIVARFVEADRPNRNKQMFTLEGLQVHRPSIHNAPMNLNHQQRRVVGTWTDTELIYPTGEDPEEADLNPYIENLGVIWKWYFPNEFAEIQRAQAEGTLTVSMECVPDRIQCAGENGCQAEFAYEGPISKAYCGHLQARTSDKLLINPHFIGGAVLLPGTEPGWAKADVKQLVAQHAGLADRIREGVEDEFPHLDATQWEGLMGSLLQMTS